MRKRRTPRSLIVAALLAIAGGSTACVDSFGGSIITVTFFEGVTPPALAGVTPTNGRAPAGTHFSFYAFDYVYQRDADGNIVVDGNGDKVIEKSYSFRVLEFEIQPLLDRSSPCFIEPETERFPGLHSTQELAKLREVTGIVVETNPGDPANDAAATENDYIDVIGAKARNDLFAPLSTIVKVVTSYSSALPPGVHPDFPQGTACVPDGLEPGFLPPNDCMDDESNAQRLAVCKDYWSRPENSDNYQGNDRVFTLPLNGTYKGTVTGNNPKNGGFLGGANFSEVPASLIKFDGLAVNWQYDDEDCPLNRAADVAAPGCDGLPDFPDGLADLEKSLIGYHYMDGVPSSRTRGVTHVSMRHRIFPLLNAEVAVFADLDNDTVQF